MGVEERMITIQLLNKIYENPKIARELGIEVINDEIKEGDNYYENN